VEDLERIRRKFEDQRKERDYLNHRLSDLTAEYQRQSERLLQAEKARTIVQIVAKNVQQKLEFKISTLVTTALEAVFDNPIKFIARFETKRGQTECNLLFEEYGSEYNPLDGSGYGPVDVCSFALRVSLWSLEQSRPVLILDEPFRNVSPDLHEKVSEMLKMISEELKLQIIMVSHAENINIAADKIIKVRKEGKVTTIS